MSFPAVRRWAALFSGIILFAMVGSGARAACPDFPQVPWWENLNHETTKNYVAAKYGGDWSRYIAKWQRQLSIIESIYARGEAGVIRSKGIRLAGQDLRNYILKIEERIAVIECLAREAGGGTAAVPNRITPPQAANRIIPPSSPASRGNAAGTTTEITVPVPGDGRTGEGFQVEITSQCEGGDTVFRVVNRGALWPQTATFVVSRSRDGTLLANRKIRMANGQSIAFRVQSAEPMELRITPSWAPDDFRLAQAHCR